MILWGTGTSRIPCRLFINFTGVHILLQLQLSYLACINILVSYGIVGTSHNHTDKHTPWSTDNAWRAQAQFIHCNPRQANTGASQPASAASAPLPIGSYSAQQKWNKIRASAGQSQSVKVSDVSISWPVI
jgi:hypothetical protein